MTDLKLVVLTDEEIHGIIYVSDNLKKKNIDYYHALVNAQLAADQSILDKVVAEIFSEIERANQERYLQPIQIDNWGWFKRLKSQYLKEA